VSRPALGHGSFGGLSAIRVAADGAHFIALTDKRWCFAAASFTKHAAELHRRRGNGADAWAPTGNRWPRGV